jgi:mannitol operon transcriptional antiterminator
MIADADDVLTIKEIAENLGVSSRTILREMSKIEKWLESNGFNLEKKPGVGLKLRENLERRKELKDLLQMENVQKSYSPEERQLIIISELLRIKEPVKLFYFTSMFNVSPGTITHDLDNIEGWFNKHNLKLIRKPGFGVHVKGKEENFRKAMIDLLYDNLEESQLIQIISNNVMDSTRDRGKIELNIRNRLLNLIDKDTIAKIEELVHKTEDKIEHKLTDSAYVGLIVHLALAVQRIKNNENITIDKDFLRELRLTKEYNTAQELADDISDAFNIKIPEDEVGYITMHLKGAKIYATGKIDDGVVIQKFELIKIVKEMIKVAEKELGYILEYNEKLLLDLVAHLIPTISRLKMNLNIRNPLLEEIKSNYPRIFEISRKSSKILEEYIDVNIPESEIGYIAMHLGAAIEKNYSNQHKIYNVIVSCASGIGTSRMLAARLEKEFKNINVIDIVSGMHLKKNWIEKENIDLIISTTEIDDNQIETVTVTPFLLEEDKAKIERKLKEISKIRKVITKEDNYKNNVSSNLKNSMETVRQYSEAILQILNNFYYIEGIRVESIDQLIDIVSTRLFKDKEKSLILSEELREREKLGQTILDKKEIILLHCRSEVIDSLKCGFIKLEEKVYSANNKQPVKVAVVLLAPKNSKKSELDVISEISRALVENEKFVEVLGFGDEAEIYEEISRILNSFYASKTRYI